MATATIEEERAPLLSSSSQSLGIEPTAEITPDLSVFPKALKGRRILLCTESFGPVNGVSRTTLMLVNHLRANGCNVAVVAPFNHTHQNTFTPTEGDGPQLEVRLHGYPLPFNPELSVVYPVRIAALQARTFGTETPPDLVYLASPASLGFQVMLQLRKQPKETQIPIICNFQTDLAGYCAILFPPPLGRLAVMTFSMVQSYLFKHSLVKTIFYPSKFVRRYLEAQGVQPAKMEVLRRGVNAELFNPSRRDESLRREIAPNGEIILICVSRIAGEKGFDFLAKAVKALHARGLKFKMYIVGGNRNAEVERQIHGMFEPLVNQKSVIFSGFKVGEDLATAYAAGDIFLHCSITETFGLVVLESMASGVPVVARDEGGPSDIIEDGRCGYLVPPDDLGAFTSKVVKLANDVELRRQMSEQSRIMACEATWDKINNKVAWKMAETIAAWQNERTVEEEHLTKAPEDDVTKYGTGSRTHGAPLTARVVNSFRDPLNSAGQMAAMAIITTFWFFTGLYLAFTETKMWFKSKVPTVFSR
jgi:glycosyltransferase involved in cell wall biosynthesis